MHHLTEERMKHSAGSPDLLDSTRDPLPAGHPFTWSLITNGTCLDGAPYVMPSAAASMKAVAI